MRTAHFFSCCFILLLLFVLGQNTGCSKEHSYEGCLPQPPPADTAALPVTDTQPVTFLPACSLCSPGSQLTGNDWSFTTGNTYVCGSVTNSAFIGQQSTFTFFGPSPCSQDTGLVMTVYLPFALEGDTSNITTSNAAFYYYDDNASKDIFIRDQSTPFSLTIQHYTAATGQTTGTFSGTVYTADGGLATITNGRFSVILK